ncbi:hypothetical protein BGX26_012885 [Mortierella sp. AD094]|nr:hypothetical protein BGX26_012885 [Mortierella sp. AD094]
MSERGRVKAHAKKIKPRFHFPCFSETYSIPLGAGLELMGHELTEYQIWEMDLGRSKDYWNNSDEEDEDDDDDEEDDGEDEATDMSF